jgi:hypothetical protein
VDFAHEDALLAQASTVCVTRTSGVEAPAVV